MPSNPIVFDKYICLPVPHNPSMQDLFYRLESVGRISMSRFSRGAGIEGYKVSLECFEGSKVMTEITDTFYQGLYRLWNRIEVKRRTTCVK
jgi:hypothetical protein